MRPSILSSANLAETNASISSLNAKQPRRHRSLSVHRSILAVDIEGSTRRTNPINEEPRGKVYRLVVEALCMTGIGNQPYNPFTDRGDGLLVLLHPVDELSKPVPLVMPVRPAPQPAAGLAGRGL